MLQTGPSLTVSLLKGRYPCARPPGVPPLEGAVQDRASEGQRCAFQCCHGEVTQAEERAALLPRVEGADYVFPGVREGKSLSNMAMLELVRGMDSRGLTVHGFRSTFRDWAGEQTNFPKDLAEAALAHVTKDDTEAAYARGDLLDKRRRLMAAWARYCAAV